MDELRAAVERARAAHARRLIRARYAGRCDLCAQPIQIGDSVAWRPNAAPTHASCFRGEVAS